MTVFPEPTTDPTSELPTEPAGRGQWPRRAVLTGTGAALLVCAACSSSSSNSSNSNILATDPPGGPTSAGGAKSALAFATDIPAGAALLVPGAKGPVLLARAGTTTNATVVAHQAICTHQGATLNAAGICPLHGSKFDVRTGAVLAGPATDPLAPIAVVETNGQVFLA